MRRSTAWVLAALAIAGCQGSAAAQDACRRLAADLAALERGRAADPFAAAAASQRAELTRAESIRARCATTSGPNCAGIDATIATMRANLAGLDAGSRRGGARDAGAERARLLAAMRAAGCGRERQAAAPSPRGEPPRAEPARADATPISFLGFFPFGRGPAPEPQDERPFYRQRPFTPPPPTADEMRRTTPRAEPRPRAEGAFTPRGSFGAGPYRTVCVRTCDGFFWPVSWSTSRHGFRRDEDVCRAACPNLDVELYAHRNPGGQVENARSMDGRAYGDLETAFAFRRSFNPSCRCRPASPALSADARAAPPPARDAPDAPEASPAAEVAEGDEPEAEVVRASSSQAPVVISADRRSGSDDRIGAEGLRGVHPDRVAP